MVESIWRPAKQRSSSGEVPAVSTLVFYDLLNDIRTYTFFEERASLSVQQIGMHLVVERQLHCSGLAQAWRRSQAERDISRCAACYLVTISPSVGNCAFTCDLLARSNRSISESPCRHLVAFVTNSERPFHNFRTPSGIDLGLYCPPRVSITAF